MNNLVLLTGAAAGGSSMIITVLYVVVIGGMLYFMMIRPQRKQQKQHSALLSTLAAGDSVLTSSGMYGVVIDVMEDIVIVEFGSNKNCRIPMKKSAVVEIEKPSTEKTN
jgi:preprotein translocase subunit YajC